MIRVLMISRSTLFSSPGGDTVQIEETAKHLRKLNVSVDIRLSNEIVKYEKYDLLHFFNIIRPNDILEHISKAKIPFVVSTIFVDYSEYERKNRKGFHGIISRIVPSDFLEYLKVIARFFINGERIGSNRYLFLGHRKSIKKILKSTSCLLPNSRSEYERLVKKYKIEQEFKVIPNAINTNLFIGNEQRPIRREGIICVGRIEGRKNQLNLIRAINNTAYNLTIIGNPSPNNLSYYKQCKLEAGKNIKFISHVTQNQLNKYYCKAKVHILPSWFETTGLSTLEAGYLGCNIVVTDKGDVKEYFRDYAIYCEPQDIKSIKNAIIVAYELENNNSLKEYILEKYTWDITAKKTKKAYLDVLNKN